MNEYKNKTQLVRSKTYPNCFLTEILSTRCAVFQCKIESLIESLSVKKYTSIEVLDQKRARTNLEQHRTWAELEHKLE